MSGAFGTTTPPIIAPPGSIKDVLTSAGIGYRPGRWLRLKGPDLDAISVNSASGAFKDHRTGEHGGFHTLCQKLGISDGGIVIDATAISRAKTDQEKADLQAIQWGKTAWSRGIPAGQPKRPAGWAQAAWDTDQEQYQDHRESVYDYLASRGLDPMQLLPLIRIQTQLNPRYKDGKPDNIDAEMVDAGADFAFLMPMYQIGKAEKPEHICGVQRTFLKFAEDKYSKVQKVVQAMLGKKGVTTLAPSSSPVILPVSGPVLGSGEGFETVASFVQTMHRPGVVCWDWSGLKAWSESLQPGEGAPLVSFLVDFDTSQTGQRECAAAVRRIMSHEHGKAVYLLPPESIQPDAKGNRDWNDLLKQSPDSFAGEIIHAWHKSEENMALAPVCDDAPVIQQKGQKDAETAQVIAEAVAQHFAYQAMEQAMADYLVAFHEYTEKLKAWQKMPKDARREDGLKRPKLPPLLIKVTTGVGKSHLMREILQNFAEKIPMLILTRTHELAKNYIDAGAFGYHGRSNPETLPSSKKSGYTKADLEKEGAGFKASDCFKYPVIELVSEKNHVPALTACRSCEHGRKFMLENYHEKSIPYLDAKDWFYTNHVLPDNVPACLWLSHQMEASHARVVVAPNASYSDTLAHQQTPEDTLERLVIVDEIPDLARHIEATSSDMGVYANKCMDASDYLAKRTVENAEEQEALDKIIADNQAALDLFQRVGAWLGRSVGKKGIQAIPEEMVRLVKELSVDWLPGATARWERAELKYGHEPFVPLRMMKGLVESIATGTAIVEAGTIHVHEITTLGDRIKKGLPTILLDATPSSAVEYMVQRKGGQIVDAIAKQHVNIIHYNQYLHGRTWKNKAHQQAELSDLMYLKEQMQEETGNLPVTLTYMPHCELAEKSEDPEWGYFGRDDVGQDNWKGRDMLIFGGPLFSPTTQALSYNSELMLKRLAGDKSSPDWNPEVARGVEVTVGNKIITSKAPLPVDPHLREWVLDNYARRMAQGIGRARAVWATPDKPINIWIAGGLPLAGLAAHGLEVSEYREEKRNMNDESSRSTQEKVQAAMASLQAAEQDTGYRAVQKELERMGLPGCRYNAWKKADSMLSTAPYNDTYKAVDVLLDALRSIVKVAGWNGVDIADAALDLWKHPRTEPVVKAAAQIILEASPNSGKWRQEQTSPA